MPKKKILFQTDNWHVTKDGLFVVNWPPGKLDLKPEDRTIACSPSPHEWRPEEARLISLAPKLYRALKEISSSFDEILNQERPKLGCIDRAMKLLTRVEGTFKEED